MAFRRPRGRPAAAAARLGARQDQDVQLPARLTDRVKTEQQQKNELFKFKGNRKGCKEEDWEDEDIIEALRGVVDNEELAIFSMPDYINEETQAVQQLNKGIVKIHNRVICKRRRYLRLLSLKKEKSAGGQKLLKEINGLLKDEQQLVKQVLLVGGRYVDTPKVLSKPYKIGK